jgi:hypothetical protein
MFVLLYLLPLGFIFDLVGYLPPSGRLMLVYALLAMPLLLKPSRQAAWLGLGLVGVMVVRAWWPWPAVAEMALLLLAHQVIWQVMAPVPRTLRIGVVVYAVVHCALFLSPLGHPAAEWLTRSGNAVVQLIAGQPVYFGPSYLNWGGLLLFLVLSVFSWEGGRIGPLRSASFLFVAVLLNALTAVMLLEQADFAASFAWTLKFREPFGFPELWKQLKGLAVIVYPGFVFLTQLAAYLVLHYGKGEKKPLIGATEAVESAEGQGTFGVDRRWQILAVLAGVIVLVVVPPTSWRRPAAGELVFLDKGIVSFTKPDYTRYGESAGGMFGMLPEYARLYGWKAEVVKEIPADLKPEQVLVITSPNEDMGEETHKRVWDFVAKGGKLWVLGDHTPIKDGRNFLNELLAPCHIAFNNDSAQFFPQGWFHSYRFPQGTPFATLRDDAENRPGLLVGASLELGVPAQPFVVGRFGYSDWGLEKPEPAGNRGHLGDFKYQATERLGDLVLVAGERHGQGRVLVFGDTTSFFNNNLTRSFELLRASLGWLGETNRWLVTASASGRMLALLLVAGFCGLAFWWRREPTGGAWFDGKPSDLGQRLPTAAVAKLPALKPVMPLVFQLEAGALLAIAAISMVSHGPGGLPGYAAAVGQSQLAVLDYSHQPNASKHSAMDEGLHGVGINLMRHGKMPIAMNDWDSNVIENAKYVVLNAPRRPVTAGERRDLMRMMERGGTVILACGFPDVAGSKELLDAFKVGITGVPLGRFFDLQAFGKPVSFMSAWGIETKLPKDAKIVCTSANWPLMVSFPVGKGELVLIADSEFLHNRNLEGHKNHDPANTAFLKNLFDSTTR